MEYMDLLPPTAPASFSRARLARPILVRNYSAMTLLAQLVARLCCPRHC